MATIKRGFTLIELLIVIAIISLLIGVLVPMIDRSMAKNKLANDVEVLRSKIEETRLLAGSTQTNDGATSPEVAGVVRTSYYGVYFPSKSVMDRGANYNGKQFYAIVRLSKPLTSNADGYCNPSKMIDSVLANSGQCLIERVDLTNSVTYVSGSISQDRMLAFAVPSQQTAELYMQKQSDCQAPTLANGYCWIENVSGPLFNQKNGQNYLKMQYNSSTNANINFEPFTGKLLVTY